MEITKKNHTTEITFETLPSAVQNLYTEIIEIKSILLEKSNEKSINPTWLNLNELCEYLPDKPVNATVYGWVHNNLIPYSKGTKKLRFLKSEIDEWLKSGRKQTVSEINADAHSYLKSK